MNIKSILSILSISILVFACNQRNNSLPIVDSSETTEIADSIKSQKQIAEEYSNERFRQVTVEKIDEHKFRVQGEAQVFEATINWVIEEDGHNVLGEGFTTATNGAPLWGKFDFTVDVQNRVKNSTLNVILFEESAEDGSQQHELPVSLK